LNLPVENPTKQQAQTILHAIEELYFLRRYVEAREVADDSLRGKLSEDFRQVIVDYKERCEGKLCRLEEGTEDTRRKP